MEKTINIKTIFIVSIILFSSKWIISILYFPNENILFRIIADSVSDSYFHYVKTLSEFNFIREYSLDSTNKSLILIPIGSVIFHSFVYKFFGIYSFIILEFFCIFLFVYFFSKIIECYGFNNILPIFLAIILFSSGTIIDLFNLDFVHLKSLKSSFYNLKFPRPLVTNLYLFYFLYYVIRNYEKELLNKKNIFIISIFFGFLLSSSFFIFSSLGIFYLTILLIKYRLKNLLKKIFIYKKQIIFSFILFFIIILPFVVLLQKTNSDYLVRLGVINLDTDDKLFLIEYFFQILFKTYYFFFILFAIFMVILLNKYFANKYNYIINILFINFICSLINPFLVIFLYDKAAFLYHFNNLVIINFFLFVFFSIIHLYKFFEKRFLFLKLKNNFIFILVALIIIINFYNSFIEKKFVDAKYRNEKNTVANYVNDKIGLNCNILTFDNAKMTWLIMKDYKNISFINGTFTSRNDDNLENNLINSLKLLGFKEENFTEYLKSEFDGWRLKNSKMQQLFWQKYQANSLYTFNKSMNFEVSEINIISKTSPFLAHQFVIPIEEKNRILKKFKQYKEIKKPDYIIIDYSDEFWSKYQKTFEDFKIEFQNKYFVIFSNEIKNNKCN